MNEFRVVSEQPGALTAGDLFRLRTFLMMHCIPVSAQIVSIKQEPFYDRTELIVEWVEIEDVESLADIQRQLLTSEPANGEPAENTPDSAGN